MCMVLLLNDGTLDLWQFILIKFQTFINYVKELVDTDESDAISVDEDTNDEESEN